MTSTTTRISAVVGAVAVGLLGFGAPASADTEAKECAGKRAEIKVTNDRDGRAGGIHHQWFDTVTNRPVLSGGTDAEPLGPPQTYKKRIYGSSTYKIVVKPKVGGHYNDADMIFTVTCFPS